MTSIMLFIGILGGFFLPGFLINRIVGKANDLGAAYIISTVILFHVIFWTGICGLKINLVSMGSILIFINSLLFCYCLIKGIRLGQSAGTTAEAPFTRIEKIVLIPIVLSIILLFLRSSIFFGLGDQIFRWFFLASRILETESFTYYPPLTPQDYGIYFFTDSFPPIASFSYFWLYSLFGKAENCLVGIPVTLQFIFIFIFGYRLAVSIFDSKKAGVLAVLLMGSSTLLFYSVMISQETGITALSLVALVYFLVRNKHCSFADILLASFAASYGALSREYSGIFIVCGVIVILWRKMPLGVLLKYLMLCFIITAPWYIRTFFLTGNPFYSNPVGNLFPVNPVHAGILEGYKESIGLQSYLTINAIKPLAIGLSLALGLPFFCGLFSIFMSFRRLGFLLLISIIMLSLWIYSISIPAGLFHSMRILSPMIVILAVCGSAPLEKVTRQNKKKYAFIMFALSVVCSIAFIQNIFVPCNPLNLKSKRDFLMAACIVPDSVNMQEDTLNCIKDIPEKSAILSDGALQHAFLAMSGEYNKNIRIVPVWSPEVRFLFENNMTFEKGAYGLRKIGINYVLIGKKGNLNLNYLGKFDFFRKYNSQSKLLAGETLFELPGN
ncbi:MAG: hypothetical protein NT118_16445 [Lentisphaerae bacterium]|nr:hypothetical protein [Lentisphaerota bacterium]